MAVLLDGVRGHLDRQVEGVAKALAEPDVREHLAGFAFEPFSLSTGEIAKQIEADSRRYGEVIKRAKISLD